MWQRTQKEVDDRPRPRLGFGKEVDYKKSKIEIEDDKSPIDPNLTSHLMSGYTKFAVIGAGRIGNCIVQELLKEKAAGIVKEVAVLTRQVKYPSNDHVVHDILSTSFSVDIKGFQ
jgi:hypothetical protein